MVLHITGKGGPDDIYLIRYYLVKSKYLNVFIHQFLRSDRDDLHDHPWNFATYLVRGAYTEHKWSERLGREEITRRQSGQNQRFKTFGFTKNDLISRNRLVFRRATDQHKVMTDRDYTFAEREYAPLTICVTGPTIRTWGFIRTTYERIDPVDPLKCTEVVQLTIPEEFKGQPMAVYRGPFRRWIDWREYLGLPPDEPGRG